MFDLPLSGFISMGNRWFQCFNLFVDRVRHRRDRIRAGTSCVINTPESLLSFLGISLAPFYAGALRDGESEDFCARDQDNLVAFMR
jgi:hypothetical protein